MCSFGLCVLLGCVIGIVFTLALIIIAYWMKLADQHEDKGE